MMSRDGTVPSEHAMGTVSEEILAEVLGPLLAIAAQSACAEIASGYLAKQRSPNTNLDLVAELLIQEYVKTTATAMVKLSIQELVEEYFHQQAVNALVAEVVHSQGHEICQKAISDALAENVLNELLVREVCLAFPLANGC